MGDSLFLVTDWKSFDSYFDLPLVNHHLTGRLESIL